MVVQARVIDALQDALVLALDGARGNFGYKKTADAPLPKKQGPSASP